MFSFLKKPITDHESGDHTESHHHTESSSHHHDHHVDVANTDDLAGEDVGQIAVDILETVEGYIVIAPLAGVHRSDVDVTISRNVLSISGNRPEPEVYHTALKTPIKECFYGPFSRSIILPENLALDTIRATIERGMLIITVPYLIVDSRSVKVEHIEDMDS